MFRRVCRLIFSEDKTPIEKGRKRSESENSNEYEYCGENLLSNSACRVKRSRYVHGAKIISVILVIATQASCATTPHKRFLAGVFAGGTAGAVGGAALSPNDESRGLNAMVFGLTGAIVGGLSLLFFHNDAEVPELKKTDLNQNKAAPEFVVSPTDRVLPKFVTERLKPMVVEELLEPDTISEDGSLHEPHKVYRIKQNAELISRPVHEVTK